jgi:hypothetical protein
MRIAMRLDASRAAILPGSGHADGRIGAQRISSPVCAGRAILAEEYFLWRRFSAIPQALAAPKRMVCVKLGVIGLIPSESTISTHYRADRR